MRHVNFGISVTGQTNFDLTNLLYIINEEVNEYIANRKINIIIITLIIGQWLFCNQFQ